VPEGRRLAHLTRQERHSRHRRAGLTISPVHSWILRERVLTYREATGAERRCAQDPDRHRLAPSAWSSRASSGPRLADVPRCRGPAAHLPVERGVSKAAPRPSEAWPEVPRPTRQRQKLTTESASPSSSRAAARLNAGKSDWPCRGRHRRQTSRTWVLERSAPNRRPTSSPHPNGHGRQPACPPLRHRYVAVPPGWPTRLCTRAVHSHCVEQSPAEAYQRELAPPAAPTTTPRQSPRSASPRPRPRNRAREPKGRAAFPVPRDARRSHRATRLLREDGLRRQNGAYRRPHDRPPRSRDDPGASSSP